MSAREYAIEAARNEQRARAEGRNVAADGYRDLAEFWHGVWIRSQLRVGNLDRLPATDDETYVIDSIRGTLVAEGHEVPA